MKSISVALSLLAGLLVTVSASAQGIPQLDQIDQDLENVAASIESQIGESNATLSFSCLKENTDQVLALFRDWLTSPEFRQDKVDLTKTQSRSEISRRNDDPEAALSDVRSWASAQARRIGFFWLSLSQGSPLSRKNIVSPSSRLVHTSRKNRTASGSRCTYLC